MSAPITISEKPQRLHGLDFCRAVFMILGLFYHTALIFGDTYTWRVTSLDSSIFLTFIAQFIHAFRMEAFYIISGFFYLLVFDKKNSSFLNERLTRIVPPLLFCGLLINPIMNYFSYERVYDWGKLVYFTEGQWLGHLWFLGNLLAYFLITFPICSFILKMSIIKERTMLACFVVFVPFLSLISLVFSKKMLGGSFIFFTFDALFYYYFYFLFGCICYRSKVSFVNVLTYKNSLLFGLLYFIVFKSLQMEYFASLDPNYIKALTKISSGLLVLSMIAITYNLGKSGSNITRKFSDSSYSIYLLHQPLIIIIYYFIFKDSSLHYCIIYSLIVAITFFIAFMTHHYLIKNSATLLFLFNGAKRNKS